MKDAVIDFDAVMQRIGPFGPYQKLRFGLLNLSVMVLYQYTIYSLIFSSYTPPHWCTGYSNATGDIVMLPPRAAIGTNTTGFTVAERTASGQPTVSSESGIPAHLGFDADGRTFVAAKDECSLIFETPNGGNSSEYTCAAWDYLGTGSTIATEWDLVCGNAWHVIVIRTISNTFTALGALVYSRVQDTMGRKPAYFLIVLVCVLPGTALAFVTDEITFTILRSLQATMATTGWQFSYIFAMEIVGPEQRTFVTSVMIAAFSIGATSMGLVAWLFQGWRNLCLATSIPFIFFLSYWFILDESPRWLLTKRKTKQLSTVCHKIATTNGRPLSDDDFARLVLMPMHKASIVESPDTGDAELNDLVLKGIQEEEQTIGGVVADGTTTNGGVKDNDVATPTGGDTMPQKPSKSITSSKSTTDAGDSSARLLFSSSNIRRKTIIIMFLYVVNAIVYIGLAFNVENLAGSRFATFAMLMIMELPAGIAINFILEPFGRILPTCLLMSIGGAAAVGTSLVPSGMPVLVGLMAAVSKFGISASFAILCQLASELFPTPLRGTGSGLGEFIGSLSMALVPIIVSSGQNAKTLPMIIMGVLSVLGGISILFLPETLHTVLPETLTDSMQTEASFHTWWDNISLRALRAARARGKLAQKQEKASA